MNGKKFHNMNEADRKKVYQRMLEAGTNHVGQSNREFAKENGTFRSACEAVGVEPTKRQAAKFRKKTGKVYKGL